MPVNPYEQLELPNGASIEECRASFKRLAKKYHPDINKAPDAAQKFILIKKSLDYLSDPQRKEEFDRVWSKPQFAYTFFSTSDIHNYPSGNWTITIRYE